MPRVSVAALLAAAGAAGTDVVYLRVIDSEGEGELTSSRVLFIAICLGAAALVATAGALASNPWAKLVLRGLAAFMLLVLTILGALSIGILLLLPTVLALRSTAQAAVALPSATAWPVVAATAFADVAIVAAGVAGTS